MPFPSTQSAMFASGYEYLRWEKCTECGLAVEVWSTPGKREIVMEPMVSSESPATRHFEKCKPKENDDGRGQNERVGDSGNQTGLVGHGGTNRDAVEHRPQLSGVSDSSDGGRSVSVGDQDGASKIKLHGVTDPNHQLIAVGWDDGVLVCQFKTAKWSYAGVPEAEFVKLRRSPFAYRIFTTNIKNKFPETKVG